MTTSDRPARPVRRVRRRRRHSRRVRLTRTIVGAAALVLLAAAVVVGIKSLTPHHTVADSCQVVGETTGAIYTLTPDQLLNASIIADVAMRRGLPEQAVIVALATAQQESKLTNLDYGDADSIGLFQQRPSQGWGSPQQILDPVYASGKFFDALVKVPNWQALTVAVAAQAVQRSAFPDAYTTWQPFGTALGAALTGLTLTQLTCRLAHPGIDVKRAKPSSARSAVASSVTRPSSTSSLTVPVTAPSGKSFAASASPPAAAPFTAPASPPSGIPSPTSLIAAVSQLSSGLASDLQVTSPAVVSHGSKSATITISGLAGLGDSTATGSDDAGALHRAATVAAWALAHASEGITSVVAGDQEWRPDRDGWHPAATPARSDAVVITVAIR